MLRLASAAESPPSTTRVLTLLRPAGDSVTQLAAARDWQGVSFSSLSATALPSPQRDDDNHTYTVAMEEVALPTKAWRFVF